MESTRTEALEWWSNIDEDKRKDILAKYFPDEDLSLFPIPSNTIEIIYLKENQNRKL